MLYTRNAMLFREYYKVEKAQNRDKDVDIDFIDLKHPDPKNFKKGFGSLIFGSGRDNVESFLRSTVLNVAADQQSVYEMIQNADDCDASFINISYNEKYLLCINNGKPFSDRNMAGLINVGDSDKTQEEIGTYGIGFKIVHRLLGDDDGAEAIVKNFAGALIFSWNKFIQFDRFLNNDEIKIGYDKEMDKENPWLIKLIYTCFPTHLNEQVRISDYQTRKTLFDSSELDEFRTFLSESLSNLNISKENFLKTGSMFFLKLADGKSKSVIEKNIEILKSGIAYSFNFLQSLNKIYINGESILAQKVSTHSITYIKDSEKFNKINPRNKERPIEAKFGYKTSFKDRIPSEIPNFYTFFSMDDEKNNFGFILHCNAFDMHSDRRKLQPDSQSNPRLFAYLTPDILNFVDNQKGKKFWDKNLRKNLIPYNELYATFLLAEVPKNKPQILEGIYLPIKKYLLENIPTLNNTFSNNPQNVKIKITYLQIQPLDFGCPEIDWFAWWKAEDNKELIEESKNPDKLGLKEWDIVDLFKYAIQKEQIDKINNWVQKLEIETSQIFIEEKEQKEANPTQEFTKRNKPYLSLLHELNNNITKANAVIISQIKLFKFSDNNYYSLNDIFKSSTLIFKDENTSSIWAILNYKLGFFISHIDISKYKDLYAIYQEKVSSLSLFKKIIARTKEAAQFEIKEKRLYPDEKKKLFLVLLELSKDSESKIDTKLIRDIEMFSGTQRQIIALRKLIKGDNQVPNWLFAFKMNQHEDLPEIIEYCAKQDEIYKNIILENWEDIVSHEKLNAYYFYPELLKYYEVSKDKELLESKNLSFVATQVGFKKTNEVFFNSALKSLERPKYNSLQELASKIFLKELPRFDVFSYFTDKDSPFRITENQSILSFLITIENLEYNEIEALLTFAKLSKENLFEQIYIESRNNRFSIVKHSKSVFQYYSNDKDVISFLENQPNFKLFPKEFNLNDFRELGILHDKDLFLRVLQTVGFSENLLPIVRECDREVQLAYLDKVDNFSLHEGKTYDKSSFEHRCLKLAIDCYDMTFQTQFAPKIIINNNIRIKDIAVKDDINFDNITLSLATVLPEYKGVSDIITKIINQFTDITKTELSEKVFPINNKKKDEIFSELIAKFPTLQYIEQFAFLLYYSKQTGKNLFTNQLITGLVNIDILQFAYVQKFTELNAFVDLSLQNKIYPSELCIEIEKLPPWVLSWIEGEDNLKKLDFISQLGVHTIQSTIGQLRNYFINKTVFDLNDIAKDSILYDGKLLINTLLFIKEKSIEISGDKQYLVLKEIVRVVNSKGNKITTNDNYCVEEIINNSKPSDKKTKEYQIFLYKGKLPKIVAFSEIVDYVYYRYNDGDYLVNNFDIYINEDCDHKTTLEKVVSDGTNGFTFEDLWKIYNENEPEIDNPFKDISLEDESYIRDIITGEYELNEKLDANTTAKIKTLLKIRDNYPGLSVSNQGYYLQVGEFKILVRSAQNGLLFLDVNHWERLGEPDIHLSIYTKNNINIFKNQEALIEFTKPQNKYGILKMPDNYDLDDLNSINNPNKKGVWRFVFIVNEDAKAAKKYKEIMDLDEYNNYG